MDCQSVLSYYLMLSIAKAGKHGLAVRVTFGTDSQSVLLHDFALINLVTRFYPKDVYAFA